METPRKYRRRTRQQWQIIIAQFAESGLTGPRFCEQHDLSYPSFQKWRSTLNSESEDLAQAFVEITPATSDQNPADNDWAVELTIGDQLVLRIRQPI